MLKGGESRVTLRVKEVKLILVYIGLLRFSCDLGVHVVAELPQVREGKSPGKCDLCDARPHVAHLLFNRFAPGWEVDDGTGKFRFKPWLVENEEHGMNLLCGS